MCARTCIYFLKSSVIFVNENENENRHKRIKINIINWNENENWAKNENETDKENQNENENWNWNQNQNERKLHWKDQPLSCRRQCCQLSIVNRQFYTKVYYKSSS